VTPRRVVVLGGGTGGTMVANRLRRLLPERTEIHVVDRDDRHVYRPGLLLVPFGLARPERLVRQRCAQLRGGVHFHVATVEEVALERSEVRLAGGHVLGYDALVVATGAELQPGETPGLVWSERVHTFYEPAGAQALAEALRGFDRGRLVVDVVDLPITCPVAPLEFAFLADWHLRERGVRDRVELVFATPLDGAFTKPVAAAELSDLLARKGIELVSEFVAGEVDGAGGTLAAYDGRTLDFDLLVAVPLHGGADWVSRTPGLGDALGWVHTEPDTLRARAADNVFALGDATDLPISKAGSVAHYQAGVVADNVASVLAGAEPRASYDGHANCFVETGFDRALLLDFDYERQPLPGHLGPLPLLRESRLNHLAKRLVAPLYWRLLKGGIA
jgi:sulfide:quinone oxidoreductase